jgi:hypothetical protein
MSEYRWFDLHWPRPLAADSALEMLRRLATERVRAPFVIEAISNGGHVRYRLGVPFAAVASARHLFAALLPGAILNDSPADLVGADAAVRMVARGASLGLRVSRPGEISRAILAALSATEDDETVVLQLFIGDGRPAYVQAKRPRDPRQGLLSQLLNGDREASSELTTRMRDKASEHTLAVMVRVAAAADDVSRRHALLKGVIGALRLTQTAGTRLDFLHAAVASLGRIPQRGFLHLTPGEVLSLGGWPLGDGELPGMSGLHPTPLRLRGIAPGGDRIFGTAATPGDERPVGIDITAALSHTAVVGATGSGKSTLLINLALADIKAGRSVCVIDAKGDLVTDLLERITYERRGDVVVIDPMVEQPVGLNILRQPGRPPELIADSLVTTIRNLYPSLWGVRVNDVLSAAALTIVRLEGATLMWLPRLLTEPDFRRQIVSQLSDEVLIGFWQEFEALSAAQQTQYVGAIASRLRVFLLRPQLRRVLDQATPRFDLADLFYGDRPKIVVARLNTALLGTEATRLVGSLLVSQLIGLTLGRAQVPRAERKPTSLYIDEAQEFLRLSGDELSDALARARGLGTGITLGFQYVDQLSTEMQKAVLANCRNKLVMTPTMDDAKTFAAMTTDLQPADFLGLPAYHLYANVVRDGGQTGWFLARSRPAPSAISDPAEILSRSTRRYGQAAESRLPERPSTSAQTATDDSPIGRRRRSA